MKRTWKQIGSLLLAFCMVFTMLPTVAFAEGDPTTISVITVTGLTEPVAGAMSGTDTADLTIAETGVIVTKITWFNSNNAPLEDRTKFISGQTYSCTIYFATENGYVFPENLSLSGVTLGSVAATEGATEAISGAYTSAYASWSFTVEDPAPTIISKITVTGVTAPIAGQMPDTETSKLSIAENCVTVDSITWVDSDSKPLADGAAFVLGQPYECRIKLYPQSGFVFPNVFYSDTATVNGASSTISVGNDGYIIVKCAFTASAPTAISTIAVTGLTKPVAGGAPDTDTTNLSITEGVNIDSIKWTNASTSKIMQPTEKFAAGTMYACSIRFTAKPGYVLSDALTLSTVTLNGKAPTGVGFNGSAPPSSVDATFAFTLVAAPTVSDFRAVRRDADRVSFFFTPSTTGKLGCSAIKKGDSNSNMAFDRTITQLSEHSVGINVPGAAAGDTLVVYLQIEDTNSVKSEVYSLEVPPYAHVGTPKILIQPRDQTYKQGDVDTILSVNATKTDDGTLSYQWYSNTTNSNTGGTEVGTNEWSYFPPTDTVGTTYYYCVITNTNPKATTTKTATVTSAIAAVTVAAPASTGTMQIGGETVSSLANNAGSMSGKGWEWTAETATLKLGSNYYGNPISINCTKNDTVNLVYSGYPAISDGTASPIYCNGNLNISAEGSGGRLTLNYTGSDALYTALEVHGILTIQSGTINAVSKGSGTTSSGVAAAVIYASKGVAITGTANVTVTTEGTASHGIATDGQGFITISTGGTVTANGTGDFYALDAGYLGNSIGISNGTVTLNHSNPANLYFGTLNHTGGTLNGNPPPTGAPAVVSASSPANGTYQTGHHLDFAITFDMPVTVNTTGGTPHFALTVGTQTRYASYVSGSGTSTLVFRYIVQPGDLDTDGITSAVVLDLHGGTIRSAGGVDAGLIAIPPSFPGIMVNGATVATYTISGTVKGSDTNMGIDAATLLLKNASGVEAATTVTNDVGHYNFAGIAAGTYSIEVSANGYNSGTISGVAVANANVTGKDLTLTKTGGNATTYAVTVNGSYASPTGAGSFVKGTTVNIYAGSRSNYTFTGWTSSDVTITNASSKNASFVMPGKAVTMTANWSYSGGDSDTGGSSGGSYSQPPTPPAPPTTPPSQPVTASAPVTATAGANGTASANIPASAILDAITRAQSTQGSSANGISVELSVTMPQGATSLTANIPQGALQSLVTAGVSQLEVNGAPVSLGLNQSALQSIQRQASGGITIGMTPATGLFASAQSLIGNRPVYNITISYTDRNGKTQNITSFGSGAATLAIPYTPGRNEAPGYLYGVYVDSKGNVARIPGSVYDANSRSILIPTNHLSVYGVAYNAPSARFTDIGSHWAKDSIDYVVGRGLLSGTSETTFAPNTAMTRGMLVTALGRLAGVDAKAYTTNSFTDVKADSPFRSYIEWVRSRGIIQGIGNGQFAPDRAITREEIAVIFANYAKATGYKLPMTRTATTFADASSIGSAYKNSVTAMQQAGIMMGETNNKFNPKSNATRAEVSSMLHRYIKLTIDPATAQGWAKNDDGQYLYYKGGKALTGTQTIDGVKCFFNTDGTLKTGWVKDGDNWRYYTGNKAAVSWLDISDKRYYFTKDGLMVSGKWLELDGKWYYFNADGSLARNIKIGEYEVDENGVRKTK